MHGNLVNVPWECEGEVMVERYLFLIIINVQNFNSRSSTDEEAKDGKSLLVHSPITILFERELHMGKKNERSLKRV
jgi:hypothetical protein